MAEVKFTKLGDLNSWASNTLNDVFGNYFYSISITDNDYYSLARFPCGEFFGDQHVKIGDFESLDAAMIYAASMESAQCETEDPKGLGWKFWAGAVIVISSLSWLVWIYGN